MEIKPDIRISMNVFNDVGEINNVEVEADLMFLNHLSSVKGGICSFGQSATDLSYRLENIGLRDIGQAHSKPGFYLSFLRPTIKSYFHICRNFPDSKSH